MDSEPLVSIICPSYGHERVIAETMRGFLEQTYKNFEIIVIDDNSPDNTSAYLKTVKDPRLRLYFNDYNMGVSNAMNIGIRAASGSIVCFCASDDILMEKHLERVVEAFRDRNDIGAVYARLEYFDEHGRVLGFAPVSEKDRFALLREMLFEGNGSLYAPGSAFRREVFENIGFFNPSLVLTHDYDINVRALLRCDFYLLPEVTVKYRRFTNSSNLSGGAPWIPYCYRIESDTIFDNYLKIDSIAFYSKVFEGFNAKYFPKRDEDAQFCLAAIAAFSRRVELADWGFRQLKRIMSERENWEYYHRCYGFDYRSLMSLYRQKNIEDVEYEKKKKMTMKKLLGKIIKKTRSLF